MKIQKFSELQVILREFEFMTTESMDIEIHGDFTCFYYLNKLKYTQQFKDVTIRVLYSKEDSKYGYVLPYLMDTYVNTNASIISNGNNLPMFYFLEDAYDVTLEHCSIDNKILDIDEIGLAKTDTDISIFLDWVLALHKTNLLYVRIETLDDKVLYLNYLNKRFIRRKIFTDCDNKLIVYLNSSEYMSKKFGSCYVTAIAYGVSVGNENSYMIDMNGISKSNDYKFEYRIK